MAITALIDIATADSYNGDAWDALTDPVKTEHIYNASVYMQTSWYCADVDWTDTANLDADLQKACAYYADADRQGYLYPSTTVVEDHRALTRRTRKLEGMEETLEWDDTTGSKRSNPIAHIDSIMALYCIKSKSGSSGLIRV